MTFKNNKTCLFKHLSTILFFVFVFNAGLGMAQDSSVDQQYQQLMLEAEQLTQDGKFEKAHDKYTDIIEQYPAELQTYLDEAELYMQQKEWGKAKDILTEVTDREEEHLLAHYWLGICDREDGVGRDQVMRRIMWRNSRKHFETVIRIDSTFDIVFLEYAKLKKYQEDYEEAIDLCLKQIHTKPESQEALYKIFYYYDLFLNYGGESFLNPLKDLNTYQIEWLKSRNKDYDIYFLGEKYRRMEQFEKADSIFNDLLDRGVTFNEVPIQLSRVRLYYQWGKPAKAELIYWQTLNRVRNTFEIRFFFDDVKYILSDQDLQTVFHSLEDLKQFYHRIWNRKNPLPSMQLNRRLEEHYKRLVKAEEAYRYDGFRLPIHNADRLNVLKFPSIYYRNRKFNDKGLVFIRFGEPDDVAREISASINSNESWLYQPTAFNPKMIFHFEVEEHAPSSYWRLVPVPSNARMLESRLGWDQKLDQAIMANSQADYSSMIHEIQIQSENFIPRAMSSESHSWKKNIKPLDMQTSAAYFRLNDAVNLVEVYMAVTRQELEKTLTNGSGKAELEVGLSINDSTWNNLSKNTLHRSIDLRDSSHFYRGNYIEVLRARTNHSKINISNHLRAPQDHYLAGNKFSFRIPSPQTEKLQLSDVILAYDVQRSATKDRFTRHNLRIIPNPSRTFSRNFNPYVYFEIYNLSVRDGESYYQIKQTIQKAESEQNLWTQLKGLFSSESGPEISITKDQRGASATSYEYSAFDFSRLDTGRYTLTITVTDLFSEQSHEVSTTFELQG
ncbi:MAG: hypothetical protein GF313_08710 [Caldithrix sp.]|nr:hypothetical protein [Caldithrix sp.]